MKKYMIATLFLVAVGITVILMPRPSSYKNIESTNSNSYEYYYNENDNKEEDSLLPNDLSSILYEEKNVPLDTNPSSLTVLVNRNYLLTSAYIPINLVEPSVKFNFSYSHDKRKMQQVAAAALEKLFIAAKKKNYDFYGISGYRSYARQKQIYDNNVRNRGVEATDSVSAKPGSSEHQTGLAMDISIKSIGCRLDQALGNTLEGKWLAKNCHKFGFIIRYPKGKEDITGYSYEPWHIRYVGPLVASYLYKHNLTLEEYYGCVTSATTGDDFANGVDVEDADNVKYATPSPKPKGTKKPENTATIEPSKTPKPSEAPKPSGTPKPSKAPKATKAPTKKPNPTRAPKPEHTPTPTKKPVTTPKPTAVPTSVPTQDPPAEE